MSIRLAAKELTGFQLIFMNHEKLESLSQRPDNKTLSTFPSRPLAYSCKFLSLLVVGMQFLISRFRMAAEEEM